MTFVQLKRQQDLVIQVGITVTCCERIGSSSIPNALNRNFLAEQLQDRTN